MSWSSYLFHFGIILLAILPFIWTIRNSNMILHAAAAGAAWSYLLSFVVAITGVIATEAGVAEVIMNSPDAETIMIILLVVGMLASGVIADMPIILFPRVFPQWRAMTPKLAAPFIAGMEIAMIADEILGGPSAGTDIAPDTAISIPEAAFVGAAATSVLVALGAVRSVRVGLSVAIAVAVLNVGKMVVVKQALGDDATTGQTTVLALAWAATLYILALILFHRHEKQLASHKNGPAETTGP